MNLFCCYWCKKPSDDQNESMTREQTGLRDVMKRNQTRRFRTYVLSVRCVSDETWQTNECLHCGRIQGQSCVTAAALHSLSCLYLGHANMRCFPLVPRGKALATIFYLININVSNRNPLTLKGSLQLPCRENSHVAFPLCYTSWA